VPCNSLKVLNIQEKINEDSLYENLSWLSEEQSKIEVKLFKERFKGAKPTLFKPVAKP
jgi:hypothetical protein